MTLQLFLILFRNGQIISPYLIKQRLWSDDCCYRFWCFDWLRREKINHTQGLNVYNIMQRKERNIWLCWSLTYILEFENVSSPLSFCWHLLLRCRSFVFGASETCRPPVDLLLGLKSKTIHLSIQLHISRLCPTASVKRKKTSSSRSLMNTWLIPL